MYHYCKTQIVLQQYGNFGFNESLNNEYQYISPDSESFIGDKDQVRDLIILISSNSDITHHINTIIYKVRQYITLL